MIQKRTTYIHTLTHTHTHKYSYIYIYTHMHTQTDKHEATMRSITNSAGQVPLRSNFGEGDT